MAVFMKNALVQFQGFVGCIAWNSLWMPTKILNFFSTQPILREFCANVAVESLELTVFAVANYLNLLEWASLSSTEAFKCSKTVYQWCPKSKLKTFRKKRQNLQQNFQLLYPEKTFAWLIS